MRFLSLASIIFITIISIGCSNGTPVITTPESVEPPIQAGSGESGGRLLWGIWDIRINPEGPTVEIASMRGADFTCNVTQFLQPPVSPNLLSILLLPESSFPSGYVAVDVTIRHPFTGVNSFNGFDVRGIFMADGTANGIHDPSVLYAGEDDTRLLNPDGYTRWWNPMEFTSYGTIFGFTSGTLAPPVLPISTVNPYKYFADDLDSIDPISALDTDVRGIFRSQPGINTRKYEIQFAMSGAKPVLHFQYAIDASWQKPDPAYAPEYPPEAFPRTANCREAFVIEVMDAGSTAWYESPADYGGEIVLQIAVSDWQGPDNLQGSLGEFTEVWLESPILGGAVEVLSIGEVVLYEDLTFTFKVTLGELALTKSGPEYLFGTVVSSAPTSFKPQILGGDSYAYPPAPLSAYFICTVYIKEQGLLPIWPTIQGNRANTGCVGLTGPQEVHNAPTWTHHWQPNPYGNPLPVFLSADTAFLSNTGDGGPLPCGAVDLITKTTKWNQQFNDDMQNWLNLRAISEDAEIALCVETGYSKIYGLDTEDGSYVWDIPGDVKADSYPTTDLDGNFIIPIEDVGYQSVDPYTGTVNWTSEADLGYYDVPAVGDNGIIYATSGNQNDGHIVAIDPPDGITIWESGSIGQARMNGVTVHPNGNIIIHGTDGLFCFRDNGTSCSVLWQQDYPCPFFASAGVNPDEDIIIMDYDGVLRKLNPATGETIQSSTGWGDGVGFRPAIGADGMIYARTRLYDENEAYMTCWNADCTLKWQYYAGKWFMGDGMMAAPSIGQDGTLYSSYRTLGLCAWKDIS